ncbi:hypothetical protein GP486_004397, partial [Trichoglossum hirsutum]
HRARVPSRAEVLLRADDAGALERGTLRSGGEIRRVPDRLPVAAAVPVVVVYARARVSQLLADRFVRDAHDVVESRLLIGESVGILYPVYNLVNAELAPRPAAIEIAWRERHPADVTVFVGRPVDDVGSGEDMAGPNDRARAGGAGNLDFARQRPGEIRVLEDISVVGFEDGGGRIGAIPGPVSHGRSFPGRSGFGLESGSLA